MSITNTFHHASGPNQEAFVPARLLAGDAQLQSRQFTVKQGQVLTQFKVIAREAASGKIVAWNPGSADAGTKIAIGVTTYAVDATAADVVANIYTAGHFNTDALDWGAANAAQIEAAFDGTTLLHSLAPVA